MNTLPDVGESIVEIIFNNVVFPLPEGPIIPTNSPSVIVKLIFKSAVCETFPVYSLLRSFTFYYFHMRNPPNIQTKYER